MSASFFTKRAREIRLHHPVIMCFVECAYCHSWQQTRIVHAVRLESPVRHLRSVDLIPWPKEEAPTRKRRKTKDPGEGVDGKTIANDSDNDKNGAVEEGFSDYEEVTLQRAAKNHEESERASEEDDRKLTAKRKSKKTSKKRGSATPKTTSKYSVGTRFIKISRESSSCDKTIQKSNSHCSFFSLRNSQAMASLRGASSLPPAITTLLNILKMTTLKNSANMNLTILRF
jgi:hypothetical protein